MGRTVTGGGAIAEMTSKAGLQPAPLALLRAVAHTKQARKLDGGRVGMVGLGCAENQVESLPCSAWPSASPLPGFPDSHLPT